MEDHDTGVGAPEVGMFRASPPSGQAGLRRAASTVRRGPGNGQATRPSRKARPGNGASVAVGARFLRATPRRNGRTVGARCQRRTPPARWRYQRTCGLLRPELGVHRPPIQELPAFAALDLGTNNCRLLVAVPTRHSQFRVIDAFSRIVRLGEGLTANGRLGQPAMDRAVEALKICGDKLRNRKIRKARLIATEACRTAANGVEFLERVEREAGLKLEIIDRQTEARLAVSGCGSLVERDTGRRPVRHWRRLVRNRADRSHRPALVKAGKPIVSWTSLPVGVVSLAERSAAAW